VGAGLLGFAINPPASLYYVQGLNMTPAHGHAALFGVYGMLGIGLMLFCLRGLYARALHADRYLGWTFWGLNIGLGMMVFMSLLPAGIYQAYASVTGGSVVRALAGDRALEGHGNARLAARAG
jgi:nitric oxide reductase subunit B